MRALVIAALTAASVGFLGVPPTIAAPLGGAAPRDAATAVSPVTAAQLRRCREFIRYRNRICRWAACGVPLPGTHKSRCGYRCPGIPGLIWSGWC
jgi:hypothetical protein